jgi:hypothetical protein
MIRKNPSTSILARTAVLLLIFAIAGLSTLAKHSQYLPKSNPTHFFSNATKMNVAHLPALFFAAPNAPIAKVIVHRPAFRRLSPVSSESIDLPQIALTISLQHRSPPSLLA